MLTCMGPAASGAAVSKRESLEFWGGPRWHQSFRGSLGPRCFFCGLWTVSTFVTQRAGM